MPLVDQLPKWAKAMLTYSKFAHAAQLAYPVPSRAGMVFLYFCPLLAGGYCLHTYDGNSRLVPGLMVAHFGKRVLECLLLHKYSGQMSITTALPIALFYTLTVFAECRFAHAVDLDDIERTHLIGVALFFTGLAGNLYHHYLLSNLRKADEKEYKIPTGGLFELVAAPHYLFELVGWLGAALVGQHPVHAFVFASMTFYLADRSVAQSTWNRGKFGARYPATRKHLVPYIF